MEYALDTQTKICDVELHLRMDQCGSSTSSSQTSVACKPWSDAEPHNIPLFSRHQAELLSLSNPDSNLGHQVPGTPSPRLLGH